MRILIAFFFFFSLGLSVGATPAKIKLDDSSSSVKNSTKSLYTWSLLEILPHDTKAFTQGLLIDQGFLYESTGLYGYSELRKLELATGKVLEKRALGPSYFGEGLALYKNQLYQLTWKENMGFIYQSSDLSLKNSFSYSTEGWGLTSINQQLVMSDGSSKLYFLDPNSMKEVRTISVHHKGKAVEQLNELEALNESVLLANIWQTNQVAVIDIKDGELLQFLDFSDLYQRIKNPATADVLNGIALDPKTQHLYLTGKKWDSLFKVSLQQSTLP